MVAPITVMYGDSAIASVTDGSKTLLCNSLVAKDDISIGTKTLMCKNHIMRDNIVIEVVRIYYPWTTPTIALDDTMLSIPYVDGVTQYKIYDGNAYIGYVDPSGVWHQKEA